ncbi:MAG: phage tail assembly chaperone [Hyphomicrobiaceae bacterium]
MEVGLGHLRYPPAVFWALTLPEWQAAHDGLIESRGGTKSGPDTNPVNGGMSAARFAELSQLYPD